MPKTKEGMIIERKLSNQREFRCRCLKCKAECGEIIQRVWKILGGKLWQARHSEATKEFHRRIRNWHKPIKGEINVPHQAHRVRQGRAEALRAHPPVAL